MMEMLTRGAGRSLAPVMLPVCLGWAAVWGPSPFNACTSYPPGRREKARDSFRKRESQQTQRHVVRKPLNNVHAWVWNYFR